MNKTSDAWNDKAQLGADADDWVPEDRAPSSAENNFMSFALFAFLILFGVGCLIVF